MALGLAALASASNLPEQSTISPASLQPSAATHETRAGLQELIEFQNANEITPPIETVSSAPPTRSSFMATWDSVSGAKGYFWMSPPATRSAVTWTAITAWTLAMSMAEL